MNADEFIKNLNTHPGFEAKRWQKNSLDRIYLNQLNGEKSSAYLEVAADGSLSMGKYFCPVKLEDLLELASNPITAEAGSETTEGESENDPVVWESSWQSVPGGGKVRFYRLASGYEGIQTRGVDQRDLDDFLG